MTKIKPLADRVVLKAFQEQENENKSKFYIPEDKNKERPFIYEVVAIGSGTEKSPITVKIGDRVLSGQYSGDEVKVNGENFKIVSMDYILAVLED